MMQRPVIWVAALLSQLACGAEEDLAIEVVGRDPEVRQWDRFEVRARIGVEPRNPFDPHELDLKADLVAPDGTQHVAAGFFYQPFQRALVEGREAVLSVGEPEWRVRFSPPQQGRWRFRLSVVTPSGSGTTPWSTVEVVAPVPSRHGPLRVSAKDHRYLRFEDGAPFFAVGENLAWYDQRGTYAYDEWLQKLAARGASYIRVWMPSWAFGIEEIERDAEGRLAATSLGDYRTRLGEAWQLDQVFERAREAGIYLMLSIQRHGACSEIFNAEWTENPYNQANGGPLAEPAAFFTDPVAKELFKRRLRYLVARWGYSDALLAWELFNEVDLTAQRDRTILEGWHREMARTLREHDPSRHLVTTSVTLLAELGIGDDLYSLPEIDLVQFHRYGDVMGDGDFTEVLPALVAGAERFAKPVLLAEVGADSRGAAETLQRDPEGIAFHDILYSGLFSRSAGTGMGWWWDGVVDPENWYVHFGPLAELVRGVVFHEEGFAPAQITASASVHTLAAYGLAGKTTVLGWIKNAAHRWRTGGDATVITDATVTLRGLGDGSWTVEWVDPYGKSAVAPTTTLPVQGEVTLQVPPFARDLALRLGR